MSSCGGEGTTSSWGVLEARDWCQGGDGWSVEVPTSPSTLPTPPSSATLPQTPQSIFFGPQSGSCPLQSATMIQLDKSTKEVKTRSKT